MKCSSLNESWLRLIHNTAGADNQESTHMLLYQHILG